MEFISNDVVNYLFNSFYHLADYDEIKKLKNFFYKLKFETNYKLYQFLFQELVWCKCSYCIKDLQKTLILKKNDRSIY